MAAKTGHSPGDIRSFLKPNETFKVRQRKSQSPRKLDAYSPLKCLEPNSPAKLQLVNFIKSPFKLRKTPIKRSQTENYLAVSVDKVKAEVEVKKEAKTPRTKRQLNFNGVLSGEKNKRTPPVVNLLSEETNLEAPVKRVKFEEPSHHSQSQHVPVDWSLKTRIRFVFRLLVACC